MVNPLQSKEYYSSYVDKITPNSKTFKNILIAFLVGGLICTIGQIITNYWLSSGYSKEISASLTSVVLIFLGAFLTALNLYNKIGKRAGAGSIIPITGFANSIVSPAIEYKSEGYVLGVGAKMFVVAGPVLVFGISSSIIYGLIYYLLFM
ncbi:MAG: stage V sporulation protein AC [Clostridiales bacterium]|nr:stage V sporulation protein AC [Clostridiales bacterium]